MTNSRTAVAELLRKGAAIVVQPGGSPMLVGVMREIEPGLWWWWEAGCESEFGGHLLQGRPDVLYDGLAVHWDGKGGYGYLTTIGETADDEVEVARLRAVLDTWLEAYNSSDRFRGFIEREMKRHLTARKAAL